MSDPNYTPHVGQPYEVTPHSIKMPVGLTMTQPTENEADSLRAQLDAVTKERDEARGIFPGSPIPADDWKSRRIQELEQQLAAVTFRLASERENIRLVECREQALAAERDALLAREIPKDPTPDGLLYRYRNDRLFHELVDQLALSKFLPERDRLFAERDAALEKLDDLERSIADLSHPNMRMLLADVDAERESLAALGRSFDAMRVEQDAERTARRALVASLLICIRYADSSADTEQAHAALALAAKLP